MSILWIKVLFFGMLGLAVAAPQAENKRPKPPARKVRGALGPKQGGTGFVFLNGSIFIKTIVIHNEKVESGIFHVDTGTSTGCVMETYFAEKLGVMGLGNVTLKFDDIEIENVKATVLDHPSLQQIFKTNNAEQIDLLNRRLCEKIDLHRDDIVEVVSEGCDDAEIAVFAYGSTARAAHRAVEEARSFYFEHTSRELQAILEGRGKQDAFKPSPGLRDFLFELKGMGVKIGLVTSGLYEKALPEILSAELAKKEAFVVVERERLDQVMREHRLKGLGVIDDDTAAEFGRVLGAQSLVSGTVGEAGPSFIVTVKQVEVETGRVLVSGKVEIERAGLIALSSDAVVKRSVMGAAIRSAILPVYLHSV